MKLFLSITSIFAWLFGAGLLLAPVMFYAPLHINVSPLIASIAQAHGATLVGLGVINWLARNAEREALKAVLLGNLVVQVLSFLVALSTYNLVGNGVFPALIIHTTLGSFFFYFLIKTKNKVSNK